MNREKRPDDLAREAAGEPPEPLRTEATSLGTVKWWKGYGAIACTVTAPWDIWCHFSAIDTSGFKSLTEGETVTVEYCRANQDSFRYIARRVRRIDTPTVPPAR